MSELIIEIEPKAQTRPKFSKFGTYEDPKMKRWRNTATSLIKQNYQGKFYDNAVEVDVTFYMPAPQTIARKPTPKAQASTWARYERYMAEKIPCAKKCDLDNLEKSLYDSITDSHVVWKDDCLVVKHTSRKIYSPSPRIEVKISSYEKNEN